MLTPNDVLDNYSELLTPEEKKEITKYHEIYFLGTEKSKEQLRFTKYLGLGNNPANNHH
jgi:hypothetical protein